MVFKVSPAFIMVTTVRTRSSSAVAISSSTRAMRSLPAIGRPCAGSKSSGPLAIIARKAAAHSIGQRCTFCGLPALGKFQITKSPDAIHFFSGNHDHRWSSVSPRAWWNSTVSLPNFMVVKSLRLSVSSNVSAGMKAESLRPPAGGRRSFNAFSRSPRMPPNWRALIATFQSFVSRYR
ncbi:unannotated protein [freshwater metagenome]